MITLINKCGVHTYFIYGFLYHFKLLVRFRDNVHYKDLNAGKGIAADLHKQSSRVCSLHALQFTISLRIAQRARQTICRIASDAAVAVQISRSQAPERRTTSRFCHQSAADDPVSVRVFRNSLCRTHKHYARTICNTAALAAGTIRRRRRRRLSTRLFVCVCVCRNLKSQQKSRWLRAAQNTPRTIVGKTSKPKHKYAVRVEINLFVSFTHYTQR